jgi:heme oxygenase
MTTLQTPPVMDLLRDATADLHKAAENHAMQKALVKGELPRERYADYLEQLWILHRALERALTEHAGDDERLGGLEEAAAMHVRHLELDLAELGRDLRQIAPTDAALDLARRIDRDATTYPVMLMGYFYVLEGSMNGNRFIARAVERIYELKPDAGLRYLCSYGEEQPPNWKAFRERINAMRFETEEREALVVRARAVFESIRLIADELDARA